MSRTSVFAYGVISYLIFFASFLYLMGFITNLVVPKSIDMGEPLIGSGSVGINVALILLFGLQHTIMARPAFKRWWTKHIPSPIERSTYVLFTSLILFLIYAQWKPMAEVVWQVENSLGSAILMGLCFAGFGLVLVSTFLIDHFDLFGLRQVYLYFRGKDYTFSSFKTPLIYKWVRHPIMLGILIGAWAAPVMTSGHLLLAILFTVYILVALQFEERDLVSYFGDEYRAYQRRTSMILPLPKRPDADEREIPQQKAANL